MLKEALYKIIERRHFWRYASFSEIAELYMSRTIRVIAMNIVSGFTSVYLYEAGYSLKFIIAFWLCYYLFKIPLAYFAARFTAHFGPKHGILVSNLLYVPAMTALGFMPNIGLASIVIWGFFMALSVAIYQLSYIVDFSKVKNADHAGKELAFMNILEKIAIGISPIIGGVIALWFGLQVVVWSAAILFILSAIPLLRTVEPTRTHQRISFLGYPWRMTIRSIIAQTGVGFDYVTTGVVWSLFIVIVVFPTAGWDVYVKLGILSSVTILTAVIASYIYGKLIDNSRGYDLLRISVVLNSLVHASRPFVNTPAMIVSTNIANEAATMGYNMSFMRGVFDTADLSGFRILYLCLIDMAANFGASIGCLILLICLNLLGDFEGLRLFFFISAGFVLIIGTPKFNIYQK